TDQLPHYMIPAAVMALSEFPLTVNGKLDTAALPAPNYSDTDHYRAPTTPIEDILATIYTQVLGVDRVSIDASFFDLGGDSLSALRLIAAINTTLNTDLPVRTVFQTPTIDGLSQQINRPDTANTSLDLVPVEVLQEGPGIPLFCLPPGGGFSWP